MSPFLPTATVPAPVDDEAWRKPLTLEERFVAEWMSARADHDVERMASLRMFARSVNRQLPQLLDELDGFDYPAAA